MHNLIEPRPKSGKFPRRQRLLRPKNHGPERSRGIKPETPKHCADEEEGEPTSSPARSSSAAAVPWSLAAGPLLACSRRGGCCCYLPTLAVGCGAVAAAGNAGRPSYRRRRARARNVDRNHHQVHAGSARVGRAGRGGREGWPRPGLALPAAVRGFAGESQRRTR